MTVDSPSVDIDTDNGPCKPGCDTTDDTGTFDDTPEPEPAPEFTEPDEPAGEPCDTTKPTEPDTGVSPNENETPKRTSTADPAPKPDARRPITVAKNEAGATATTSPEPSALSSVQFATPTFESHTHCPTDCFVRLDTDDNDDNAKPTGTETDNDGTALEGNEPTLPNNTVTSETPTPATGTIDASAPSPSTNTTFDDAPPTTDEPDEPSTPAAATPAGPNKPATINTDTTTDRARGHARRGDSVTQ